MTGCVPVPLPFCQTPSVHHDNINPRTIDQRQYCSVFRRVSTPWAIYHLLSDQTHTKYHYLSFTLKSYYLIFVSRIDFKITIHCTFDGQFIWQFYSSHYTSTRDNEFNRYFNLNYLGEHTVSTFRLIYINTKDTMMII